MVLLFATIIMDFSASATFEREDVDRRLRSALRGHKILGGMGRGWWGGWLGVPRRSGDVRVDLATNHGRDVHASQG